jgi:TRAP-type C4-dicarboxylate transport system substrate-binding protein
MLGAIATSPLWIRAAWAESTTLKISHQFPGGSVAEGDFRDRLVRRFAARVEKRTHGKLKFSIYPQSTLMKPEAQFGALAKGGLDLALVPLSYAGPELPEANIGLMPGLVTSYEQGFAWKNAEIGKELTRLLADKGFVIVSWIWQAGGVASRGKAIVEPEDVRGLKMRGGSHEMNLILAEAGATVTNSPSNEIYAAMRGGALDAALTSSTSLISFRLAEVSKTLTTARGGSYWFMFEPLLMSRVVFDRLSKEEQAAVMAEGAEMEAFARRAAKEDDAAVAAVFSRAGARVVDLDRGAIAKWQEVARATAWKDFADRSANCSALLALAEKSL